MHYRDLLAVDSQSTLNFFHTTLQDASGDSRVSAAETIYVASILASYAQTSRADTASLPPFASLSDVFDMFVMQRDAITDPELLEIAGAQSLLLAGFFRDQMQRRHNVEWYDQLGTMFYERATQHTGQAPARRALFGRLAVTFPQWTAICQRVSRTLGDRRFLLRLDGPTPS